MNVETCGHVADLIVMAHAFAELRDGVVPRPARKRFQIWAQFRSNPLPFSILHTRVSRRPTGTICKLGQRVSKTDEFADYVPGRSHGRVEGGMKEVRAGLAPTARGHAARDLQSEMPHTRGIPCDNAERTERHQREGGKDQP
eukprot:scaffold46282_cov32-Phaeocystis_antarctica.AAC.1